MHVSHKQQSVHAGVHACLYVCVCACMRVCGWGHTPVQSAYEVLLEASLYTVHQEVHDGLGHGILQVLAHNIKVGLDQQSGDLHLDLLLLTHPPWHPQYLLAIPTHSHKSCSRVKVVAHVGEQVASTMVKILETCLGQQLLDRVRCTPA